MGAAEKSILKKCGEIFIDIKMKNKIKRYKFNCVFCDVKYDQIKKLYLHIEEEHLQKLYKDCEDDYMMENDVPETKTEVVKVVELKDDLQDVENVPINNDPLETIAFMEVESKGNLLEVEIKEEEITEQIFEMETDTNWNENDNQDFIEDKEDNSYSNYESSQSKYNEERSEKSKLRKNKKIKLDNSNVKEVHSKMINKKLNPKKSLSKINEKELCIALLEAFEKQPNLWMVKRREKLKIRYQKYYEIVANEVNEKFNLNISSKDAKSRITKMRKDYAYEMQKKNNGEEYELPWCTEHMKFLQENLKTLVKHQRTNIKYGHNGMKKITEAELSILIDIYKKYEDLWQTKNLAFVVKLKRDEVFKKIVEELKEHHNLNLNVDNLHRRVSYMLRIYSENKMNQIKCELENAIFAPSSSLYEKMSFLKDAQGPFRCLQCNEIIEKYDSYQVHVAKHNDTIPFSCPLCKRDFHDFKLFVSHARQHFEKHKHKCKICNRGFHSITSLAIHEVDHTGEYPYLCQICGARFKTVYNYDNHVRRHEQRFRFTCHICNRGFNNAKKLEDHVKAHLDIRDTVCKVCGKSFTSLKYLRNHQLIHSEEKRYKCKVCGKAFAQDSGLRQHKKQHKPFADQYETESSDVAKQIDNRQKLFDEWQKNPNFLLEEYHNMLYDVTLTELTTIWPPTKLDK